jgi:hypothetical protein
MAKSLDSLSPNKPGEKSPEVSTPLSMPVAATPDKPANPAPPPAPIEKTDVPMESTAVIDTEATPAEANPDSFESLFPEPSVAIAGPPTWIWWMLLIVSSVGLGYIGYKLVNNKVDSFIALSPTPTVVTAKSSPTTAATATAVATPTPASSATPASTVTPAASPTSSATAKSAITMRVLNGTLVNGAATTVKGVLEKAGFTVRTTGNAKSQSYQSTTIYYQTGNLPEAQQVQAALSQYSPSLAESTSLASPDMILVVYGAQ